MQTYQKPNFFRRNHNKKLFIVLAIIIAVVLVSVITLLAVRAGKRKTSSEKEPKGDKVVYNTNVTGDAEQDPENVETEEEEGTSIDARELAEERGRSNGIDVSKWQGKIDWQKVKNSLRFSMQRRISRRRSFMQKQKKRSVSKRRKVRLRPSLRSSRPMQTVSA